MAKAAEALGAGELMLNCIDRDGTGKVRACLDERDGAGKVRACLGDVLEPPTLNPDLPS